MVHTLTFSGFDSVTVNGNAVTSPYTLQNGDVIVATSPLGTVWDSGGPNGDLYTSYSLTCNGESYSSSIDLSITNSDIDISCESQTWDATSAERSVLTINYTETPTISFTHRYQNSTLIGTGTYKFRRYSVEEPVVTPQLAAPQHSSVDGVLLTFDTVENAETYDIFADGTNIGAAAVSYAIDTIVTNGTYTGADTVSCINSATITFTADADANYNLPDDVVVTGADSSWDKSTGVLTITNPTRDVTVTCDCAHILTGTTWKLNKNPNVVYSDSIFEHSYSMQFISNGEEFSHFSAYYIGGAGNHSYEYYALSYATADSSKYVYLDNSGGTSTYRKVWMYPAVYDNYGKSGTIVSYDNCPYTTISIIKVTGGADNANKALAWLQANATQQ